MNRSSAALALSASLIAACSVSTPPPQPEPQAPEPVIISAEPSPAETPPPAADAVMQAPVRAVQEALIEQAPAQQAPVQQAPVDSQKPQRAATGRFRVSVVSVGSADEAAAWMRKLEAAGYPTELLPVQINGKSYQRVLVPGYTSLAEAQAAVPAIEKEFGVQGVWVTSRRRALGDAQPAR